MHAPAMSGDVAAELQALADDLDEVLA